MLQYYSKHGSQSVAGEQLLRWKWQDVLRINQASTHTQGRLHSKACFWRHIRWLVRLGFQYFEEKVGFNLTVGGEVCDVHSVVDVVHTKLCADRLWCEAFRASDVIWTC